MPINATWHTAHRMPKHPTPKQRLAWHVSHAKHCGCRELLPSALKALRKAAKSQ